MLICSPAWWRRGISLAIRWEIAENSLLVHAALCSVHRAACVFVSSLDEALLCVADEMLARGTMIKVPVACPTRKAEQKIENAGD